MSTPAVELVGLTKSFGSVTAVDDLDLRIEDGEFFSMLGPSGSGKTTVLRMIAGFEQPRPGGCCSTATTSPHVRRSPVTSTRSSRTTPCSRTWTSSTTSSTACGSKRCAASQRRDRAMAALESVQLEQLGHRRPTQLSGGQRQRVALARALVNRPKVLLLDEPLGALDLKLRREMQLELKQLQREVGITFVFVTHDQEEALTMSDRIAVFNDGRIEQVGTPRSSTRTPAPPSSPASSAPPTCSPARRAGRARTGGHVQHPPGEDPPRLATSSRGNTTARRDRGRRRLPRLGQPLPRRPRRRPTRHRAAAEPAGQHGPGDELSRAQQVTVGWARGARHRPSRGHPEQARHLRSKEKS